MADKNNKFVGPTDFKKKQQDKATMVAAGRASQEKRSDNKDKKDRNLVHETGRASQEKRSENEREKIYESYSAGSR